MMLQNILLFLYESSIYIALIFILMYYISGSYTSVYIKYFADLSLHIAEEESPRSFREFCTRHGISPRETEIINEICKGLSNQQIADRLFISLQTVKDHTHRIYNKTNCSSRAQLISLVNEGPKN
jgi:DNA-binding NarL/FixJ family response regulator